MRKLQTLLLLLFLITPALAGPGPVDVVQGFFEALNERRSADAWSFLNEGSRSYIVSEMAGKYSLDEAQVRKLFDTNDPQTQAFWEAFRTNMNAEGYAQCKYWLLDQDVGSATVGCKYGGKQMSLYAVQQNGSWGFDYFTTYVSE